MSQLGFVRFLIFMGGFAFLFAICALVPYTSTAIPECRVVVTNSAGKPIDNAEVYETAFDGDFGRSWAEKKVTDREGKVTFPARTMRASLMQRALASLVITQFMHMPSSGPKGLVSVCDEGRYAEQDISPGKSDGNIHFVLVPSPCRRS
jgi:hypothetical protein